MNFLDYWLPYLGKGVEKEWKKVFHLVATHFQFLTTSVFSNWIIGVCFIFGPRYWPSDVLSVSLVTKWGQETSWLFFLLVWFQGAKVHTFPDESTTWTLDNSVLDTWEFQSWRRQQWWRWWWRTQWTGASSQVLSLRETWASQLKTQKTSSNFRSD